MSAAGSNLEIPTNDAEVRKSAEEMDEARQKTLAYEYLCHLAEAKKWLEACLREELPPTTELEENLRNGVYLAKLAHFMDPEAVPLSKIYDIDQKRYRLCGLQFRHTDNINHFLKCMQSMQLPLTFQPETTDIYDKKNMPRVIYCIHALSTHLFKLGRAPQIQDLYGKINFTEAEIDAVKRELQKYGIQMPAFQKIGGLLTNSMAGDTAALHAAVIAINSALTDSNKKSMMEGLRNKAARLQNVEPGHINEYYETLLDAKDMKTQAALNRSLNDSYVPDAYDELLTPAEIQGHLNNVNARLAYKALMSALTDDDNKLITALKKPALGLHNIYPENVEHYRGMLEPLIHRLELADESEDNSRYWQDLLQPQILKANEMANEILRKKQAVDALNNALENNSEEEFLEALLDPELGLANKVDRFAVPLYYEELMADRNQSGKNVSYEDIVDSLRVLTAVAAVTKAVETGSPELVFQAMSNRSTCLTNLDEEHKVKYYRALAAARKEAEKDTAILTYRDIQDCVNIVNERCNEDGETIDALNDVNRAVRQNDVSMLSQALNKKALKLRNRVRSSDAIAYMLLLRKCLRENHRDGSELWLEDVQEIDNLVTKESQLARKTCFLLLELNNNLSGGNYEQCMTILEKIGVKVSEKYKERLYTSLRLLNEHKENNYCCSFARHKTSLGLECWLDFDRVSYNWKAPRMLTECHLVTRGDIDDLVKNMTSHEYNLFRYTVNIDLVIKLQAHIRGYLFRKRLSERYDHFRRNIQKIVKIQAYWRGALKRRAFKVMYMEYRKRQKLEWQRKRDSPEYWRENEDKIIKIQAFWRGKLARRAFLKLLRMEKPPFPVVRHFSAILNFNAEDYDKDLQLQQLKNDVVQTIKYNQKLAQQLDSMDIKIGLLIQNRITLQDVIAHGKHLDSLAKEKNLKSRENSTSEIVNPQKGLKSLTKEGRRMLEGYQHLFYLLQTNPDYLARLLLLLPQSKSNKFLQNVILIMYNFGSYIREEYLMLKLFGRALQEEIMSNYSKPSEIVTGNPLVLKMVVHYTRQLNGNRALRQIIGPLIEKILSDKSIIIDTNPVDIFKTWRNQLETERGQAVELPYILSVSQALKYEEVQQRLARGIETLKEMVLEFMDRITQSRDLIPYGMLYMAKVLYDTLQKKFPKSPEKDILKVVGNLLYYHFINAAIVAPDAFEIVSLPFDKPLSDAQRRNLASIAKILQFAASKRGFGEEAPHLTGLNPFIIECHEKFKIFFRSCCKIPELDDQFSIHEYTEATLIDKPEIYICVKDICDTHSIVLDYQYEIAPDPMDPLHELLDELPTTPTVATLMGVTEPIGEAALTRMGKMEINLVLVNKFEVPDTDDQSLQKLFIKTRELLVSVLQFLKGDTLVQALDTTFSPHQERTYDANNAVLSPSAKMCYRNSSSLNDCRFQLRAYLNKLEMGGWVSRDDGYQSIVTAVAKDLCNKGKFRTIRNKEIHTLRLTRQRLQEKTKYYAEQVEYYNEYIQRCLENLHTGKGSLRAALKSGKNTHSKLKSKATVKLNGAKLAEKGLLLEIDGLSQSQLKNASFEIKPTEQNGIFSVKGKFMGVEVEKIEIDIQKLLELQFEGKAIMDLFGKAKVNVNLLLYLLNRKFYGKT